MRQFCLMQINTNPHNDLFKFNPTPGKQKETNPDITSLSNNADLTVKCEVQIQPDPDNTILFQYEQGEIFSDILSSKNNMNLHIGLDDTDSDLIKIETNGAVAENTVQFDNRLGVLNINIYPGSIYLFIFGRYYRFF